MSLVHRPNIQKLISNLKLDSLIHKCWLGSRRDEVETGKQITFPIEGRGRKTIKKLDSEQWQKISRPRKKEKKTKVILRKWKKKHNTQRRWKEGIFIATNPRLLCSHSKANSICRIAILANSHIFYCLQIYNSSSHMRLHTVIKIISYKLIFTYEIAHNNESDVSPSKAGDCLWFHVTAMVVPMTLLWWLCLQQTMKKK